MPIKPKTRLNRIAAKIDTRANREEYRGREARRKRAPSAYKQFGKADREWGRYERVIAPKRPASVRKRGILSVRKRGRGRT